MWSYYGSKFKIIDLYPSPKFNTIIEPFAGAAQYSLKYFENDITIVDKYETIIKIWEYLQEASEKDISGLPHFIKEGEKVSDLKLDEPAALLMGFLVGSGSQSPRNKASYRATTARPNRLNFRLKRIEKSLFKIRHWKIIHGSYIDLENQKATWFIDPPYQFGGSVYIENNKGWNYDDLGAWCKSRKGQAIVCENAKAEWLDFLPMIKLKGSTYTTTESIWSNCPHNFTVQQRDLF